MKLSEMNLHQRNATALVREVMSEEIAGRELILLDYKAGDPEYDEAKEFLGQGIERLAKHVYDEVMLLSRGTLMNATHIRFAGKQFIMSRINARLVSWGYGAGSAK